MAAEDSSILSDNDRMPVPTIRHEWYQTETHIIVTIYAKNSKNANVAYGVNTLSVSAKLPSGNDYSLELDLAHEVVPEQCTHKIVPSKIEIKLKKRDGTRWTALEGKPVPVDPVKPIPQGILEANTCPLKYPSSCKNSKDWDKVAKEIEKQDVDDELQGEAALNSVLEQIYGGGSDEVKRAMNKSFQESGGTVLSTNWSEVGKGKVERKPPHGMEWKPWDS